MRVWNRRDPAVPADAVYVGRPTRWGNPFIIGPDGDRSLVIGKFREWLELPENQRLVEEAMDELRGRDLVCWCAPRACHADVWLEVANQ